MRALMINLRNSSMEFARGTKSKTKSMITHCTYVEFVGRLG